MLLLAAALSASQAASVDLAVPSASLTLHPDLPATTLQDELQDEPAPAPATLRV